MWYEPNVSLVSKLSQAFYGRVVTMMMMIRMVKMMKSCKSLMANDGGEGHDVNESVNGDDDGHYRTNDDYDGDYDDDHDGDDVSIEILIYIPGPIWGQ